MESYDDGVYFPFAGGAHTCLGKFFASYMFKNIVGNFRGSEDVFWTKVVKGFEKFLESPFK